MPSVLPSTGEPPLITESVRYVGLDVHKRVVAACLVDATGKVVHRERFARNRRTLKLFATKVLRPSDHVALEATTIVNGRIDAPDDWDVFSFEGRAGAEIVAEVYARRLNSPLDSVLRLTDASGRQLAMNDDFEDKGAGLTTHQADSYDCPQQ